MWSQQPIAFEKICKWIEFFERNSQIENIFPFRTFVRLGEHDLRTDTEARHVDIKIARVGINIQIQDSES